MRPRFFVLAAAMFAALTHVVGVLLAYPVWRYAEVLTVVLLMTYVLLTEPPAPRWVMAVALGTLLIDAVRTLPAAPRARFGSEWRLEVTMREHGPVSIDTTAGFTHGLGLSWAAALVAGVLLVVWRRGGRRRHPMTAAAVSGVLVIGYAVFRVVDIGMQVNEHRQSRFDTRVGDAVAAASLAVVAPVVLALLAFALAAALAGHGRRLAAVGAALLAVAALPHVDAALGAVPELFGASRHTALFAVYAVAPSVAMPQPVPALTAAVELAAYLLLIAGLTRPRPMPAPAVKTSTTR